MADMQRQESYQYFRPLRPREPRQLPPNSFSNPAYVQSEDPLSDPSEQQAYSRPSQEQLNVSQQCIQRMKAEFNALHQLRPKHIPDHERQGLKETLERLYTGADEIEQRMPMYHAVFQDQTRAQRLIEIIMIQKHQRHIISSREPYCVLDLALVQRMAEEVENEWQKLASIVFTLPKGRRNMPGPSAPTGYPHPPQQTTKWCDPQHAISPHHQFQPPWVNRGFQGQQTLSTETDSGHTFLSRLSALSL